MILCIAPNVTLERTWVVPNYRTVGVFRVKELLVLPSGKGINVARAVQTLGGNALGMGFVDIDSILNTLEVAGLNPDVMYELDRGNAPMSARDTAEFGKAYLMRLGYKFPMA